MESVGLFADYLMALVLTPVPAMRVRFLRDVGGSVVMKSIQSRNEFLVERVAPGLNTFARNAVTFIQKHIKESSDNAQFVDNLVEVPTFLRSGQVIDRQFTAFRADVAYAKFSDVHVRFLPAVPKLMEKIREGL